MKLVITARDRETNHPLYTREVEVSKDWKKATPAEKAAIIREEEEDLLRCMIVFSCEEKRGRAKKR